MRDSLEWFAYEFTDGQGTEVFIWDIDDEDREKHLLYWVDDVINLETILLWKK